MGEQRAINHDAPEYMRDAAERAIAYAQSVVERIRAEETRKADLPEREEMTENRAAIDELVIGDWVSWNALDPEIAAVVTAVEGDQAVLALYEFEDGIFVPTELIMPINVFRLEKIQRPAMLAEKLPEMHDQPEDAPESDPASDIKAKAEEIIAKIEAMNESEPMAEPVVANRDKWLSAAWKIKARLEGSEGRSLGGIETRSSHVELRAEGDGRTFSGYAAVFGEPSLPLPFTEIVKPGAFKRSLQSRNRMMLLWNHDTSNPLASTRNGSLSMVEDARGLKVTATLPDTTLGRDIAELVRTGVVDAMSFGFSVKRDTWSQDGQTRYLEDVSLYEVSLVSTPAYEQTSGTVSVRSAGISADALADALLKIESGDELNSEQGALMRDVIERLSKTETDPEPTEPEGDITALYKKKLALAELSA
jgi:HK97 family phage prohead protease